MYLQVTQQILHRDACSVELEYVDFEGVSRTAVGVSRRHPTDSYNEELGYRIAYSRALDVVANRLFKQAQGLLKHHENALERKQEQKIQKEADARHFAYTLHFKPWLAK